ECIAARGRTIVVTKFHLRLFLNFVADEWNGTWGDGAKDFTGDFYIEMAKSLERACFDYILLEDKLMVSTAFGGTMQYDLKHGVNPKHDPVPLAVAMLMATSRIGVVPTMSTSFYPPFLLARLCSTIDHMARGRFGWNVVTSAEDRAAQNFGFDKLFEHDERYARAEEFLEVVTKLWDSWEPGAIVRDKARAPTRITPRCTPSTSRASTSSRAGRSTRRAARRAGRPSRRPARRCPAGSWRASTPTPSWRPPTGSRR